MEENILNNDENENDLLQEAARRVVQRFSPYKLSPFGIHVRDNICRYNRVSSGSCQQPTISKLILRRGR
jgi:hypothetical protein